MRRPPNFLPRRFLMREKKNNRNATSNPGRNGTKIAIAPPIKPTRSSIKLKNEVDTPDDAPAAGGLSKTLSTATTPAITAPTTSQGKDAAPTSKPPPAANSIPPASALTGTITMLNARSRPPILSSTASAMESAASTPKTGHQPSPPAPTNGRVNPMNPKAANRAASASGKNALTPATEASPRPMPMRRTSMPAL